MTKERDIFLQALECATPEARADYLQRACGQEAALRQQVEALLAENSSNDKLLTEAAVRRHQRERIEVSVAETAPPRIHGYRLLQKLGEGGMGEVWLAEPQTRVGWRVALKLIKMGMDTRAVIAHFEAESRALSLMDHPNIARVLDAGATGNGRPYLVMELVGGTRLTDYSDENQLTIDERLKLFLRVCRGVAHAHRKGIIHLDLKPSNVLMGVEDGVAVPKLIDFGVAKAIAHKLNDKTLYAEFQTVVGTPAYMSPEQLTPHKLDIDIRSDIYSLGALLYELLVGRPPFEPSELMSGGLVSLQRVIGQQEPLKPSARLKSLRDAERAGFAQRRGVDAPRLIQLLRGDLDRIVMKSLDKDRTRRYATADAVAKDIERYLGRSGPREARHG